MAFDPSQPFEMEEEDADHSVAPDGDLLSDDLVSRVKQLEGFTPKAYGDFKQISVGYGTRARSRGEVLTEEEADRRLREELKSHALRIDGAARKHGYQLVPSQRDALVSFDYNTGSGADILATSGGDVQRVVERMGKYVNAGGGRLEGLVNRRRKEVEWFGTQDASGGEGRQAVEEKAEGFDPSTPFELEDDGGFDPTQPFELEDEGPMDRERFAADYRAKQGRSLGEKAQGFFSGIGEGVSAIAGHIAGAAGEFVNTPDAPSRLPATLLEGAARGTYDMGDLARRAGNNDALRAWMAMLSPQTLADPRTREAIAAIMNPDEEAKIDRAFAKYQEDQAWETQRREGMDGRGNLAPQLLGDPMPQTAEVASLVLDPTVIVPAAGQATKLANIGRRGVAHVVAPAAHAAEVGGRTVTGGLKAAEEGLVGAAARVGVSPEAARAAARTAGVGSLVTTPGQVAGAIAGGARVAEAGGQVAGAVARETLAVPSQLGVAGRIAKDASKPGWLRRAAERAGKLPERVRRAPGLVLEGALQGAAIGGGLSFLAGEDARGIGRGVGSGAVIGPAATLFADALPSASEVRQRRAQDGDILRTLDRQWDMGGDVDGLARLPREQLVQISTLSRIFEDTADIVFVPPEQFAGRGARERGAGSFRERGPDGRSRVVVNTAAVNPLNTPGKILAHELGHALLASPVANRDSIRAALSEAYSPAQLDAMGREYARRTLEQERLQIPPQLPRPPRPPLNAGLAAELGLPVGGPPPLRRDPRAISEAEVSARFRELEQESLAAGDIDGRDWVRGEVMAEHVAHQFGEPGLTLPQARKGATSRVQEALVSGGLAVLDAIGIPIDPTGRVSRPMSQIFRENPLASDPAVRRMVRGVMKDRTRWLSGLHKAEDAPTGTPLVRPGSADAIQGLADSPTVDWRPNPSGHLENDFARLDQGGRVTLKDPREILQAEKERATQALSMVPPGVLPPDAPQLGRKKIEGKEVVTGRTLPPNFDFMDRYSPATRAAARFMEQGRDAGGTISTWYHQIGSGANGSWAASVRKNLGNVQATQRELAHVTWELSKVGNIYGRFLDVGAARAHAFELQGKGDLTLWGGNVDALNADVMAYLKNHADGKPGEAGIGTAKRDFINGFLSPGTKAHKTANPVYSGKFGRSLIKSFRLDRMQRVQPTGRTGWTIDYPKLRDNLMPDAPAQFRKTEAMPEIERAAPVAPEPTAAASIVKDTLARLDYRAAPEVVVFGSAAEIPRNMAGDQARSAIAEGATVEAFYLNKRDGTRQMVMVMDGLSQHAATLGVPVEQRLQMLALHEVVHHHHSMGALFPKESQAKYQRTIEGVLRHMKPSEKKSLADLYGFDAATPEGRVQLAEEYLARVSETAGRQPEWTARVIAQIRELLRGVFPEMAWSDGDIHALLDGARRRANKSAGA